MDISHIKTLVKEDLKQVDDLILSNLHSNVSEINEVGNYLVNSGGKRLRPLVVLLCAKATAYAGQDHILMASVIEFIHTATLLHDDVVDKSTLRRNKKTINSLWGNQPAVLIGDFLYSRAFQIMLKVNGSDILDIMAHATNTIAEGEVLQLLNQNNPMVSEENYLNVIHCKTAKLFEAAAELTAILAQSSPEIRSILAQYGKHLGLVYQIIDDLLDYQPTNDKLGKNIGDDLAEGKPTLPLIYLLNHGSSNERDLVQNAIKQGCTKEFKYTQSAIQTSGAIEYTKSLAQKNALIAQQAISELPDSPYRQACINLVDFAITRTY